MKAKFQFICAVLVISLMGVISVDCSKNIISPEDNSGNKDREKEIAERWSHFTENDIEFSGQFEQETTIAFTNSNGEDISTSGFPGIVLISFGLDVPIKGKRLRDAVGVV